jgi:hypothetical protein
MKGEIAHKGDKAPIQAGQRWHVERTNAWHNNFNRLQRRSERAETVIDAFFDLADAIITLRRLIREAWTLYREGHPPGETPLIGRLPARPLSYSSRAAASRSRSWLRRARSTSSRPSLSSRRRAAGGSGTDAR